MLISISKKKMGEIKHAMPNNFEVIKLVRANFVAQAIFFRIVHKLFRKIAYYGFLSLSKYSEDIIDNGNL